MDNVLRSPTRRLIAAAAGALLLVGLLPASGSAKPSGPANAGSSVKSEKPGNYDSRTDLKNEQVLAARTAALAAKPTAGIKALRDSLGNQGIVDIDSLTGTPRLVAKLDGFLTSPSKAAASSIALNYVRSHADVFGMDSAAVSNLTLRQDYVDIVGTHHLSFVQTVSGAPVFGNGLKAHVTKDGRLVSVDGSPLASVSSNLGTPKLSATQAHAAAVKDVFGTAKSTVAKASSSGIRSTDFVGGDHAQLVAFQTAGGIRLGWESINLRDSYIHVVDASTGRVLFRQSMSASDNGLAWQNYPGAPAPGSNQATRFFTANGWLPNHSTTLNGNVAHVFLDINDNDLADSGEEVGPSSTGAVNKFNYPFVDFTATVGGACSAQFQCSWDPTTPFSWQTNAKQNAVQMLYFLGTWHDHLKAAPIGFTNAAGNFEAVDGDAVDGNAIDGANTAGGLPDGNHADNANMSTPPDGFSPRMQMYLFPFPPDPTDPFIASNSGDESDIVYHEYTHGLSNRLVVDAFGISTLGNIQAGSMGEAWSDWYAYDYLVRKGLQADTAAPGEIRVGNYVGAGADLIRTQPMDCAVGVVAATCPGTPGAGPGGYTYGDFGRIIGRPEVHADGEIWAETLWDLRKAIGSNQAESLVTRAMELSPSNPSFLDERNAILQADMIVNGGAKQKQIWKAFAARGMGYFAGATDGDDAVPNEDFSTPPPAGTPTGTLQGTVTDQDTHAPISGVVVGFGGHQFGAGSYAATTNGAGQYVISGIIAGTYPKVFARGVGYDPVIKTVSVASHTNTLNWQLRRDWAALANGGTITDFNGVDFTPFGCGPSAMIDQSQGSGWSSDTVYAAGVIDPRFMVVKLPQAVNISELDINPANTCGDGGSASTGDFSVETSPDGVVWTLAASGHFGLAQRNMHAIPLSAGTTNVLYVRYTMGSAQVTEAGGNPASCPGAPFSGCLFVDSVELAVYGAAV